MSVLVAVFTLDRVGRRITLYCESSLSGKGALTKADDPEGSAVVMAVCLVLCTIGARAVLHSSGDQRATWGAVVAAFTFV